MGKESTSKIVRYLGLSLKRTLTVGFKSSDFYSEKSVHVPLKELVEENNHQQYLIDLHNERIIKQPVFRQNAILLNP